MGKRKDNLNELSEEDKKNLFENHIGLLIFFAKKYIHLCKHLEFDDLIREGYLGLIRAAELFDKTRGMKFSSYGSNFISSYLRKIIRDQEKERTIIKLHSRIISLYNSPQGKEEWGEDQKEIATDEFLKKHLSPKELTAIKLTFGLGAEALSCEEAGKKMGYCGANVSSIVRKALIKLKKALRV